MKHFKRILIKVISIGIKFLLFFFVFHLCRWVVIYGSFLLVVLAVFVFYSLYYFMPSSSITRFSSSFSEGRCWSLSGIGTFWVLEVNHLLFSLPFFLILLVSLGFDPICVLCPKYFYICCCPWYAKHFLQISGK